MEFIEQKIKGVWEIRFRPIRDDRGFFMRTYDQALFEEHGIHREWVQENHTSSAKRGTLRGLHFQFPPHAEAKLLRAVKGEVFDVFVDLREDSDTFGQWGAVQLSAQLKNMVFIPRGMAHGYCTLTDLAELVYKADNFYAPESEGGIRWDDPELGIVWPFERPVISEKDAHQPSFRAFCEKHSGISNANVTSQ